MNLTSNKNFYDDIGMNTLVNILLISNYIRDKILNKFFLYN